MIKDKLRDALLLALEKAADGAVVFADFYDNPWRFGYEGPRLEYSKSNLSKALSRLRKKGLIEKTVNEGEIILRLTHAGRDWLFFNKSDDLLEWDGVWRLVIFDIPEKHSRVRNVLRRRLKEWGFKQWQKSLWASRKPLTKHLRNLVKQLGVEEWVLVIESSNTGR